MRFELVFGGWLMKLFSKKRKEKLKIYKIENYNLTNLTILNWYKARDYTQIFERFKPKNNYITPKSYCKLLQKKRKKKHIVHYLVGHVYGQDSRFRR